MNTTVTVNHNSGTATSETPDFFDPKKVPPPLGVDLFVMTCGGVIVRSRWKEGYLAWYPLPKVPLWLKEALRNCYKGNPS